MDLQLQGKRAVVTGGSRGIGLAIARALVAEGADVAIVARDRATLDAAAHALGDGTGRHVHALQADTGDDASVRAMVEGAVAAMGGVDILVNCAAQPGGQARPPALAEITTEALWEDVNVKVMGYLRCAREVAPQMIAQGWGRIINVSGLAARQTGSIIGSIRNVGVAALTKNLADELGRHGINVTVVHPGLTRTERTAEVVGRRAAALGVGAEEAEAGMVTNAIGRMVEADEVAWVVAFLASPRSVAVTGDAVATGGGVPRAIHY